ncbi:hypothetical protein S40288_07056 [Stachybotrys chartarum IBT 40288]|nr:hypothetical protein S40288_07056 [Stachybotrys chartarum IBT 40288]
MSPYTTNVGSNQVAKINTGYNQSWPLHHPRPQSQSTLPHWVQCDRAIEQQYTVPSTATRAPHSRLTNQVSPCATEHRQAKRTKSLAPLSAATSSKLLHNTVGVPRRMPFENSNRQVKKACLVRAKCLNDQRPRNVYWVAKHIRHTLAHSPSPGNGHASVVPTLMPRSPSQPPIVHSQLMEDVRLPPLKVAAHLPPPLRLPNRTHEERGDFTSHALSSNHALAASIATKTDMGSLLPPLVEVETGPGCRLPPLVEAETGRRCRLPALRPLRLGSGNDPCGSCASFTTNHHQDLLWPSQTQTSTAVPFSRRPDVNAYIQQPDAFRSAVSNVPQVRLDFHDEFWSSNRLNQAYGLSRTTPAHDAVTLDECPLILSALASRLNAHNTPYDFFGLLEVTGCMSVSREDEKTKWPVLYNVKLLLREVVIYAILTSDPTMRINTPHHMPPLPKPTNLYQDTLLLHHRISEFLKRLDDVLSRGTPLAPKEWLVVFSSFCIYSTVRAILFGMSLKSSSSLSRSRLQNRRVMYYEYEACIRSFAATTPDLFSGRHPLLPFVAAALAAIGRFVRRDTWTDRGLVSSVDFLSWLDKEVIDRPDVAGVNRQSPGYSHKLPKNNGLAVSPTSTAYSSHTSSSDTRVPSKAPFPRVELPDGAALSTPRPAQDLTAYAPPMNSSQATRRTAAEARACMSEQGSVVASAFSTFRVKSVDGRPRLPSTSCSERKEKADDSRRKRVLRRHRRSEHQAVGKTWVCSEPSGQAASSCQVVVPLTQCKRSVSQKLYRWNHHAAGDLRRVHFAPRPGGKASGGWPPMTVLKDWMHQVCWPINTRYNDVSSDAEDEHIKQYCASPPSGCPPTIDTLSLPPSQPDRLPIPWSSEERWNTGGQTSPSARTVDDRTRYPCPGRGPVAKDPDSPMLIHQKDRPEKCPYEGCKYQLEGFTRRDHLNRHVLIHSEGKMICPFCPSSGTTSKKSFSRTDSFKRHLESIHKALESPLGSPKPSTNLQGRGSAKCSVCQGEFDAPQIFYEHLGRCPVRSKTMSQLQLQLQP